MKSTEVQTSPMLASGALVVYMHVSGAKYYQIWKKCASGRGIAAKCLFSHTSQKAQLRAPLSPLQTAWTGFDPNLYSSGSSSAGPALVEIATARSLNRGIVTCMLHLHDVKHLSMVGLAVGIYWGWEVQNEYLYAILRMFPSGQHALNRTCYLHVTRMYHAF